MIEHPTAFLFGMAVLAALIVVYTIGLLTTPPVKPTRGPSGSCVVYVEPETLICSDGYAWKHQDGVWINLGTFRPSKGMAR